MDDQGTTLAALGVAASAGVPVLLWGPPGTGKTSAVRALAAAAGWPCEVVIASIREPSDFAGLPVVSGGVVEFAPPRWATRLPAQGRSVVFFDEISTAPPAVQAALLRVVLERVVGDLSLPAEVSVLAAANPPEQAADGWDLSAPLANRFCHLEWAFDPRAVVDGFIGGWPVSVPPELPDDWEAAVAAARGWIAGFLAVRPALTLAVPDDLATAGKAWPSPRTWDMAARLLTAARSGGVPAAVESVLVRGCVGTGAGIEFLTWLIEADLPDPEAVLADPDSFVLPARGDRAYAALASVAAAVAARPEQGRWEQGWRVFGRAAATAPDVAAAAARTLARSRPAGMALPREIELFLPLLRDADLLQ